MHQVFCLQHFSHHTERVLSFAQLFKRAVAVFVTLETDHDMVFAAAIACACQLCLPLPSVSCLLDDKDHPFDRVAVINKTFVRGAFIGKSLEHANVF